MSINRDMRIGEALTRLAVARGGRLDDITAEVYAEELESSELPHIEEACRRLRRAARREFETLLPDVGTILDMIATVAREQRQAEAKARLLPMAEPRPLTPEELEAGRRRSEDFLARLRQVIDLKKAGLK